MSDLIYACSECGHLHWTGDEYITCPIRDCTCAGQTEFIKRDLASGRFFGPPNPVRAPRLRLDARGHTPDTRGVEVFFQVTIEGDLACIFVLGAVGRRLLMTWDMQLEQLGTLSAVISNRLDEYRTR